MIHETRWLHCARPATLTHVDRWLGEPGALGETMAHATLPVTVGVAADSDRCAARTGAATHPQPSTRKGRRCVAKIGIVASGLPGSTEHTATITLLLCLIGLTTERYASSPPSSGRRPSRRGCGQSKRCRWRLPPSLECSAGSSPTRARYCGHQPAVACLAMLAR